MAGPIHEAYRHNEVMARDPRYQRLLNSKRWKELRISYLREHPLCERCQAEGYVRAAIDCHHIRPISSAMSIQEMERLCYLPRNLQALCIPCHIKTHKEMHKGTKANRKEREAQRMSRWSERVRQIGLTSAPIDLVQTPSDSEISLPRRELRE